MGKRRQQDTAQQQTSIVKAIFQVYQCLHHLSLLRRDAETDGAGPFERKASELDRFLKPAMPNRFVFGEIKKCNRAWAKSMTQVLMKHYLTEIEVLKGRISGYQLDVLAINQALNLAKSWALRNFGRKFQPSVFTEVGKIAQNFSKLAVSTACSGTSVPKPCSSSQMKEDLVGGLSGLDGGACSTPRKRARSTTPDSSPSQIPQSPKRSRPEPSAHSPVSKSSYSSVAGSPPARTSPHPPSPFSFPFCFQISKPEWT